MGLKFWGDSKSHAVTSLERPSRISNMTTPDLRDWMDLEIMHLGQAYDQWRYHNYGTDEVAICGQSSRWVHRARWVDSVNTEIGDGENVVAVAGHLLNRPVGEGGTGGTLFHLSCGAIPVHHGAFIGRDVYTPPVFRQSRDDIAW